MSAPGPIESLSAVTVAVADMARSTAFYGSLGFVLRYGGADEPFSSYVVGEGFLNLQLVEAASPGEWGRSIFYVDDVDAMYERCLIAGVEPEFAPRDAPWGERYFHVRDPDGHEVSFARPLR